jgi:uncharacterized protein
MNDTRVNGVGSSAESQLSSRQTIDAGRLAQSILSTNGRGTTRNIDGIKADLDQLEARNPDLAAAVRPMVVAGLTPVERGQLAAANDAGPPRAAKTVTGPDNQPIFFQPGAPSIAERFAAPAGSAGREFYNRLDRLFGDGNPATNDVTRIEAGLTALYNQGQTLEQAEAAAIASQGQAVAATGGGIDARLAADLLQVGLDVAGIFEPTPFADLANAGISLGRGIYDGITNGSAWDVAAGVGDAAISVAGVFPGIGDTAKVLRLGRHADTVARAITEIAANPALRSTFEPMLRGIKETLDRVSPTVIDALPQEAADSIRTMKAQLDEFFGAGARNVDEIPSYRATLRGQEVVLDGVRATPVNYVKRDRESYQALRSAFESGARADFARSLTSSPENLAALRRAGLDDAAIARLAEGGIPQGWQVHHKLPLDDGGTNAFDNLVLIKNDPYHLALTNAQRSLVGDLAVGGSRQVDFPIPDGIVYPPTP